MSEIITVGLNLAKNVFQAHGADGAGQPVLRKKLRRGQVLAFFSELQPCVVAMEADLPPGRPSFITRVLGVDSCRLGLGQARLARSPQRAQALGALQRVFCCPAMSAA